MLTHKRIRQALHNWNLEKEEIKDVFYDNGERNRHAFYVGNQYVIKIFANLGNLKKHIDISQSLENCGLSAATPVKTVSEEEQLYFLLTRRLEGQRIKVADLYCNDYKRKARFIGEILGQLSVGLSKIDAVANDKNIYEIAINWALPTVKEW